MTILLRLTQFYLSLRVSRRYQPGATLFLSHYGFEYQIIIAARSFDGLWLNTSNREFPPNPWLVVAQNSVTLLILAQQYPYL